jgi:hypothetical protein
MAGSRYDFDQEPARRLLPAEHPAAHVFDFELGQIFIQMRSLLGLGLWDMARAVGGEPTVVADLEAGAIGALPPWPEVSRLVRAYAHLAEIDPQPILQRLALLLAQYHPAAPITPPAPMPAAVRTMPARMMPAVVEATLVRPPAQSQAVVPAAPRKKPANRVAQPVEVQSESDSDAPRFNIDIARIRWRLRRAVMSSGRGISHAIAGRWSILVCALGVPLLVGLMAWLAPATYFRLANALPTSLGAPLRSVGDTVVELSAPVHDGLTWIDIGDPQVRKSSRWPGKTLADGH